MFDIESFRQSVAEPDPARSRPAPKADDKWPVKGFTILEAWSMADPSGDYVLLRLADSQYGEVVDYVLREGDLPGLPFAEELAREIDNGLIEIQPGPPPEINPQ